MAILATMAAQYTMQKGLTYTAMQATVWALGFIAVARVWHVIRENVEALEAVTWPEMTEYSIYAIAYIVFIVLTVRAGKAIMPEHKK